MSWTLLSARSCEDNDDGYFTILGQPSHLPGVPWCWTCHLKLLREKGIVCKSKPCNGCVQNFIMRRLFRVLIKKFRAYQERKKKILGAPVSYLRNREVCGR